MRMASLTSKTTSNDGHRHGMSIAQAAIFVKLT